MSRAELYEALIKREYEPELANEAASLCVERGFVDDRAYAGTLADRYRRQGYGARAIAARMRQRGIDRETIDETLEGLQYDDSIIDTYIKKSLRGETTQQARSRAFASLYRRGFKAEQIKEGLQRVCGDETEFYE